MWLVWAFLLLVIALACTLFWFCTSISVYEPDFSEIKTFEMVFLLLMMLGLAAYRFGDAG